MGHQSQQLDKYMEGEWKQFIFKRILPEDHPKILEHLRKTFYIDELACQLLEFGEPEFELFDHFVVACLNQNDDISFYAEDKATGKVAGIRITYKNVKKDKKEEFPDVTDKMAKVLVFSFQLKESLNTFEKYGITYFADFLIQSVDPEFRQKGLATEMYARSVGLLRERGYPLCQSLFTSPHTRRAVEKLGFEEIGRLYLKGFKNEKGEILFPTATSDMFSAGLVKLL